MKNFLNKFLLLIAVSASFSTSAWSQCVYTTTSSGTLTTAANGTTAFSGGFTKSSVSGGTMCTSTGSTPTSGTNDVIVINGGAVTLVGTYTVAAGGSITVKNGGSLTIGSGATLKLPSSPAVLGEPVVNSLIIENKSSLTVRTGGSILGGNLALGDGSGSNAQTAFLIEQSATYAVTFDQITVNKATVTVNAGGRLNTGCNLVLLTSNFLDNGVISVGGNLDLSLGGANNTICGTGGLAIQGCVFGGNGAVGRLGSQCAASLSTPTICARKQPTPGCVGPLAATNTNEAACDAFANDTRQCFGTVLPVELILFTATANGKGVALHWITASEKNNENFTVERSGNGKAFRSIRTLPGAGNSQVQSRYDLVDEQPLPGMSYYRLRQTDFDGTSTYSPVRAVSMAGLGEKTLQVYPGSAAQEWVVSSTLPAEMVAGGSAGVKVYDALGRVQQVTSVADAALAGRWLLDLHALPAGVYIVRLVTSTGSVSQRIVK